MPPLSSMPCKEKLTNYDMMAGITDLPSPPEYERQRDVFVFHCCIGCRVGDLLRLKKRDVINGAVEDY